MNKFPERWITVGQARELNPEWLNAQIRFYGEQKAFIYEPYADFLQKVLGEICRRYAPLAILQARPKGMVSFAEKAALKAAKYEDEPVFQMTDLCGARAILQTIDEVERICACLRRAFDIDEKNSLDARGRLRPDQFGYSGFHLIVQVKQDCKDIFGVTVPEALRKSIRDDRFQRPRAEIQVRTVLEHAWAGTFHDRLYKTDIKVPEAYMREAARLAAIMEDADGNTSRLAGNLDAFGGQYATYMAETTIRKHIGILKIILEGEKQRGAKLEQQAAIALRMAGMAASLADDDQVIALLKDFENVAPPIGDNIRFLYGLTLCHKGSKEARRGREVLGKVEGSEEGNSQLRAAAAAEIARSWLATEGHEADALAWFRKALGHDPDNPYDLASLLECEAFVSRKAEIPTATRSVLEKAIATCRKHIQVGLELPRAYATIGRLRLLLGQATESLCAYAKAVEFCNSHGNCMFSRMADSELCFLARVNFGKELPPEHENVRRFLLLAKAVRQDHAAQEEIQCLVVRTATPRQPVMMLVGGATLMAQDGLKIFHKALSEAISDFPGTVISGGTKAGVPGILGEIVADLRVRGKCPFEAIAYLPTMIPSDAPKDDVNYELLKTTGTGFSPAEPIQGWIDIIAAGVEPGEVRVIGYDGGKIAAVEYRLALALGARVCVLTDSGREAAALFKDEDWRGCRNLVPLPATCVEAMSLRAFLYPPSTGIAPEELDKLGRAVHENYCAEQVREGRLEKPANMQPWDELRSDYKDDNKSQAAYAYQVLRIAGYGVRPAVGTEPQPVEFKPEEIELMAKAEHGRWVIGRLNSGWQYGRVKDNDKRISPYLCAWSDIPESVRKYDRDAVNNFPAVLAKAGLEIYRL